MFSNDYINYLIERGNDEQTQLLSTVRKLPVDFFDTLCAFLNTNGGEILFAYSFENSIKGLTENEYNILEKSIITGINNANKIHPKPRIVIKNVFYHNEKILYLKIPNSQSVHTTNNGNDIYERRDNLNISVENISDQLRLQERKRFYYPDNKIIRYIDVGHFNMDVYNKAMKLILQTRPSHPWLNMDFEEVMKSSGLWRIDLETKESGYTVAAILLFGKNEVIRAIFPSFRIDALREKEGFDGYYDRETFTTNLIDTYYHLMDFVHKHLPDFFVINNTTRVGIRDLMYREVFINFLTHQDYSSGLPAKFAITHLDGTFTANSNRTAMNKNIDLSNYQPIPKNPIIGRFLRELGLAEELGFGLKKIAAFVSQFSDEKPQFHDGPTFLTSIPPITKKNAIEDEASKIEKYLNEEPPTFLNQIQQFRQFPFISNHLVKGKPDNDPLDIFGDLSESKKERLISIILFLNQVRSSTTQILIKQLGVSRETIAREIKILKENRLIEFKGALKNGYYNLTEKGLSVAKILSENKTQ
ncbi:RNA-binding domain-containing protein [Emticicia sp. BO119]|uniref:RNA-binding domain-containing protein n=1 Tax=Emticicia sp. BO119 TaxID=2757768 RepID=UPI0015F0581D|nr:RNA-binding domain-containing protein [Emticicia sp. BO119]MBA4853398.1 putative DNA binding domain-containing protein [Emticicia sp. BO119]